MCNNIFCMSIYGLFHSDRFKFLKSPVHQALIILTTIVLINPKAVYAQLEVEFFKSNCVSCHTIGGGPLVGPDLKDVTVRQPDRDWLIRFIRNPKAVIDSGDAYALKIMEESRGVIMAVPTAVTPEMADALLKMIEAESQLEESQFKGMQVDDRPFTDADRLKGEQIFTGKLRLTLGGPACIGCHTVSNLGGLGGGRLGLDLTKVYETIGGRTPLTAWLYSPATPTMSSIFAGRQIDTEERRWLVAYFEQSAMQVGKDNSNSKLNFFLLGLGGAIIVLALMDGLWRRRFRAVRQPMVSESLARIKS